MTSRVARKPITVPSGVEVNLAGQTITIKGKLGRLQNTLHPAVKMVDDNNALRFEALDSSKTSDALAGTMRANVNNMITGVSEGFVCELVLKGVGYRAKAQGKQLDLTLGFSHPVHKVMPEGVTVETPSNTEIILKSSNKHLMNQVAANIRALRPPEPYKGKGIRYKDERIVLKEGKKK